MRSVRSLKTERKPHSVYEFLAPGLCWAVIIVSVSIVLSEFLLFIELLSNFHGHDKILWYDDGFEGLGVGLVAVRSFARLFRGVFSTGSAIVCFLLLSLVFKVLFL